MIGDSDRISEAAMREEERKRIAPFSPDGMSALCLSGGGIRSASFSLGVLEGLAGRGLLSKFDYLSTVSGGGYIGSWLSAWSHRTATGIVGVEAALARQASTSAPPARAPEPVEERNLRAFTNYLTPRLGLMSADTWTFLVIMVRNFILNWMLLLPLFLLAVMVPRLAVSLADWVDFVVPWGKVAFSAVAVALYAWVLYVFARQASGGGTPSGVSPKEFARKVGGPGVLAAFLASLACTLQMPGDIAGVIAPAGAPAAVANGLECAGALTGGSYGFSAFFGSGGALLWAMAGWLGGQRGRAVVAAGVSGMVAGLVLAGIFAYASAGHDHLDNRGVVAFGMSAMFLTHAVGQILLVGLTSARPDGDGEREWLARAGAWFAIIAVVWAVFAGLVLFDITDTLETTIGRIDTWLVPAGGLSGVIAAWIGRSAKTCAVSRGPRGQGGDGTLVDKAGGWIMNQSMALLAIVFFVSLIWFLSHHVLGVWVLPAVAGTLSVECASPGAVLGAGLLVTVVLGLWLTKASGNVNINKFSMHASYRNRLIRAYLGASNLGRSPDLFTGFAATDNLAMAAMAPALAPATGKRTLFHVVNIALNLVQGEKLEWQERKASSFIVTPLRAGADDVGYRPSNAYGGGASPITLGTAMAISGAAASPNMGYHSSPGISFLMTLFNVRLGWWLGNPANDGAWRTGGPDSAFRPLLSELFGLTTDTAPYVYLSDGGHFENLALYEMVRRRCRFILAIDAGCDPDFLFADLGNAIRKVRIDHNAEITFSAAAGPGTPLSLINRPDHPQEAPYWAIGDIGYADGSHGLLVYIKPAIHGTEPQDVLSYAAAQDTFPHETTADQFFSESQFESYRALGRHIIDILPVDVVKAFFSASIAPAPAGVAPADLVPVG
jgi:hypothetical protein